MRKEAEVHVDGHDIPIHSFSFGSEDPTKPTLIISAGVHGLERIGTRIVVAYLASVLELMSWDKVFLEALEHCRLFFYPLVNPGGMYLGHRSNANGIDLMRNGPVESTKLSKWQIAGGHRLGGHLPWFRGQEGSPMELESKSLCDFVQRVSAESEFVISLDVHSGFGAIDRLWFPYASNKDPFPRSTEVYLLKQLLDRTYPNHIYCVEPQSKRYLAHGDLWDHLYIEHEKTRPEVCYLPLSLEIGSWRWAKKNPRQILSLLGIFNPILPHRRKRAKRRHLVLFDFLIRATRGHRSWSELTPEEYSLIKEESHHYWYESD